MSDARRCNWCAKLIVPGDVVFWTDDAPPAAGLRPSPAALYCSKEHLEIAFKRFDILAPGRIDSGAEPPR